MAKRRGKGEGSIYQRAQDGAWCGVLDLGRGPDGKRRRHMVTGTTRQEVVGKLREFRREVEGGLEPATRNSTLAAWLAYWSGELLDHRVAAGTLRESTARSYRQHVRDHIVPAIGSVRLGDLRASHVRALHGRLLSGTISPTTAARVHATLRKALTDAERDDLITSNPAKKVPAPKGEPREPSPLPVDKAQALLRHEPEHPWSIAFVLMLTCGLRVGETLALRWSDVDLDTGALTVRRQVHHRDGEATYTPPKSARSRRTIAMPATTTVRLREHRRRQAEQRLQSPVWSDDDLIVCNSIGNVLEQSSLWRRWRVVRDDLGISDETRLHDLRHSVASLALLAGVPLRAVADLLGHAQTSVTADTYSHVLDEMKLRTAAGLDSIFDAQ